MLDERVAPAGAAGRLPGWEAAPPALGDEGLAPELRELESWELGALLVEEDELEPEAWELPPPVEDEVDSWEPPPDDDELAPPPLDDELDSW